MFIFETLAGIAHSIGVMFKRTITQNSDIPEDAFDMQCNSHDDYRNRQVEVEIHDPQYADVIESEIKNHKWSIKKQ